MNQNVIGLIVTLFQYHIDQGEKMNTILLLLLGCPYSPEEPKSQQNPQQRAMNNGGQNQGGKSWWQPSGQRQYWNPPTPGGGQQNPGSGARSYGRSTGRERPEASRMTESAQEQQSQKKIYSTEIILSSLV